MLLYICSYTRIAQYFLDLYDVVIHVFLRNIVLVIVNLQVVTVIPSLQIWHAEKKYCLLFFSGKIAGVRNRGGEGRRGERGRKTFSEAYYYAKLKSFVYEPVDTVLDWINVKNQKMCPVLLTLAILASILSP